jgi:transcriptional regulator with XRE-family HTH domain
MTVAGGDFGGWLRDARERAGVSLDELARRTKVSSSKIRALERNDLSRWPGGIFRRGFVRDYATYVGLDPDEVLAAFTEAFPETEVPLSSGGLLRGPVGDTSLRLSLADEPAGWRPILARVGAAATDLMAPIVLALPSGLLGDWPTFWLVLALVAVLYASVGTLVLGTTLGAWMMERAHVRHHARPRQLALFRSVARQDAETRARDEAAIDREVSPAHR